MEKKDFLDIAKIINTHGVGGELKLECWCDTPDVLKKIKFLRLDGTERAVERARVIAGGFVLVKLEGINDLNEAMKHKNKILSANRSYIPKKEGSHFICDMIGLSVIDANTGKVYGTLEDVQKFTVQEIYYIKTESGTVMMPNVPEYVKEIDEEKGIFITPIKGFFDGEIENAI